MKRLLTKIVLATLGVSMALAPLAASADRDDYRGGHDGYRDRDGNRWHRDDRGGWRADWRPGYRHPAWREGYYGYAPAGWYGYYHGGAWYRHRRFQNGIYIYF